MVCFCVPALCCLFCVDLLCFACFVCLVGLMSLCVLLLLCCSSLRCVSYSLCCVVRFGLFCAAFVSFCVVLAL